MKKLKYESSGPAIQRSMNRLKIVSIKRKTTSLIYLLFRIIHAVIHITPRIVSALVGVQQKFLCPPGGHRKCALPNSNFHDGFDLKFLLCFVKSPCGDSMIDNGGDFRLMGFALLNLFP
jgi:hypothetical protein